jgi:hypothetical protein
MKRWYHGIVRKTYPGENNMETPTAIKLIDGLLDNCNEIVEYLQERPEWNRSKVLDPINVSKKRTSETLYLPMLSWSNDPLIHEMNRRVWQELDLYAKEYDFGFSLVEDVSVQRYQVGDYYKAHVDSDINAPRIVSAVLYLNTVPIGGETRFTLFDYAVKPIEGRLAIFPSNYAYRHEALPPKKGVKIAAAYWARP